MQLFYVAILLVTGMFALTAISGAPWVPIRSFDIESLLDDARVTKGKTYVELGCGDGRGLQAAARRGALAIGYELNPLLWAIAWIRCARYKHVNVRLGNFWRVNLSAADVVMAFLVPRTMPRLGEKAAVEMKPDAYLVSYIFEIPGRKPVKRGKNWLVYQFAQSK